MSEATLTTGEVITIAEGYLACDMDQVYRSLETLLDDNLMLHQLPRAASFVEPYLREDFGWLNDLPARPNIEGMDNEETKTTIMKWLSDISAEHGELHKVPDLSGQVMYTESREDLESIIEQLQEFLDRPEKWKIPDYVSFLELSGVYYSRVEDYWLDEDGVAWDTGELEDKITALDDKNELRYIG